MQEQAPEGHWVPFSDLISLSGKGCVVTGAAAGIGFAIARRTGEAGASVLVADANADKARQAADRLSSWGYKAVWTQCDVTNSADVKNMVKTAISSLGSIDILVNNAGIYPLTPFIQIAEAEWDRVMAVNLKGAFLCAQETSRTMIEQKRKGCIINIGSTDALHPSHKLAHYDASKGGLLMLTKNMASELAQYGIRVNMIAPGHTTTEGTDTWFLAGLSQKQQENLIEGMRVRVPLGRVAEPDDMARVAVFLASEASSFMTGSVLLVDGGRLLR